MFLTFSDIKTGVWSTDWHLVHCYLDLVVFSILKVDVDISTPEPLFLNENIPLLLNILHIVFRSCLLNTRYTMKFIENPTSQLIRTNCAKVFANTETSELLGLEKMAVAAIWIASDRIKIIQMNTTITADLLFRRSTAFAMLDCKRSRHIVSLHTI